MSAEWWEAFWIGYSSGVMTGAGAVLLVRWWVRYMIRKALNDDSTTKRRQR